MNMQVRDFIDMFIFPEDQRFRLWDNDKEEIVFDGCLMNIPRMWINKPILRRQYNENNNSIPEERRCYRTF